MTNCEPFNPPLRPIVFGGEGVRLAPANDVLARPRALSEDEVLALVRRNILCFKNFMRYDVGSTDDDKILCAIASATLKNVEVQLSFVILGSDLKADALIHLQPASIRKAASQIISLTQFRHSDEGFCRILLRGFRTSLPSKAEGIH